MEVATPHRCHLPANSDLTRMISLRWAQPHQTRHLQVILPLQRAMRRRQGPDCYPRAAAARHLEPLPYLVTSRQMIFPHWVVGLCLHSNLHNSNSSHPKDNNNLNLHHMTITHPDWAAFLGLSNTNNNPVCSISDPERSRVSNQKPKSSGCVICTFARDVA